MSISTKLKSLHNEKTLREAFVNDEGAIDLASIMVGIIVIGIIGGVIAATVFAVIPWSQDNGAKNQLDNVSTAESAYRGLAADKGNQAYAAYDGTAAITSDNNSALLAKNIPNLQVYAGKTSTGDACYISAIKSQSGKTFFATDKTKPAEYLSTSTVDCGDADTLSKLVSSTGGGAGTAKPVDFSVNCEPTGTPTPSSGLPWADTGFTGRTATAEGSTVTITVSGAGQTFCDWHTGTGAAIGNSSGTLKAPDYFYDGKGYWGQPAGGGAWSFTKVGSSISDDFTLSMSYNFPTAADAQAAVTKVNNGEITFNFVTTVDGNQGSYLFNGI